MTAASTTATLIVNISGCLLIGVLMVLLTQLWVGQWLLRPFLGAGVLGGYTTFSGYILDIGHSVFASATGVALAYLVATLVGALGSVWVGAAVTRWVIRAHRVRRGSSNRSA